MLKITPPLVHKAQNTEYRMQNVTKLSTLEQFWNISEIEVLALTNSNSMQPYKIAQHIQTASASIQTVQINKFDTWPQTYRIGISIDK